MNIFSPTTITVASLLRCLFYPFFNRDSFLTMNFCFIDYAKAFDCVDHNKVWKILRNGNTRPLDLLLEKSVCRF